METSSKINPTNTNENVKGKKPIQETKRFKRGDFPRKDQPLTEVLYIKDVKESASDIKKVNGKPNEIPSNNRLEQKLETKDPDVENARKTVKDSSENSKSSSSKNPKKIPPSKKPRAGSSTSSQKSTAGLKQRRDSFDPISADISTLKKVTEELEDIVSTFQNNSSSSMQSKENIINFQTKTFFQESQIHVIPKAAVSKAKDIIVQQNSTFESCQNIQQSPIEILNNCRNAVQKAIKDKKTFTLCGPLNHPVRISLLARGWTEKYHKTYPNSLTEDLRTYCTYSIDELVSVMQEKQHFSTCQKLIKSKLLQNQQVDFFWGNIRDDIYKETLDKNKLTTVNKLRRDIFKNWYEQSNGLSKNHPRSYNLSSNEEIKKFVGDFRKTAAINVLVWAVTTDIKKTSKLVSPFGKIPLEVFHFALNECCKFIKKNKTSGDVPEASDNEWNQFLEYFYKLVHCSNHFKSEGNPDENAIVKRANFVLGTIRNFYPNLDIDGTMNIWVLKPINEHQNKDNFIHRNLQQILKTSKANDSYYVQKYIERPLLIHKTKFDVKVWFLISNCFPLTAYFYKEGFLKFSPQTYNVRKLHELSPSSDQNKAETSLVDTALPDHNIWNLEEFKTYLTNIGYANVYDDIIYPEMKNIIMDTILAYQDSITSRRNCFELKTANFILGEDFQPWLINISSGQDLKAPTPATTQLYSTVFDDLIKVVIDRAQNSDAATGGFELLYKKKAATKAKDPRTLQPARNAVSLRKTDSFKQFGDRIKSTLKTLLDIIKQEKNKREMLKSNA